MSHTTYKFKGIDERYESNDSSPVGGSARAKINVKRMQEVLASPSIQMPDGLTKEEIRAFIIAHASPD